MWNHGENYIRQRYFAGVLRHGLSQETMKEGSKDRVRGPKIKDDYSNGVL